MDHHGFKTDQTKGNLTMKVSMRTLLLGTVLGAAVLAMSPSQSVAGSKWANVWPFPDCVYSCGNQPFHAQCTC